MRFALRLISLALHDVPGFFTFEYSSAFKLLFIIKHFGKHKLACSVVFFKCLEAAS